jgi:hypothetical protein
VIADCTARQGTKERDLAYQIEQCWCDDVDITRDCYFFDTDANIAMCYERNEEGQRFKYPGEDGPATIIKIGKIKYQLRKGETRTFEQASSQMFGQSPDSVGDNIEMTYDPATGQLVTPPSIVPLVGQTLADQGYIADKVFPIVPVDDPKDPNVGYTWVNVDGPFWTDEAGDSTSTGAGDASFTVTYSSTYDNIRWWKDDWMKLKSSSGTGVFIRNVVA